MIDKLLLVLNKEYSNIVNVSKKFTDEFTLGFVNSCYKPATHLYIAKIKNIFTEYGISESAINDEIKKNLDSNYRVASNLDNWLYLFLIKVAIEKNDVANAKMFTFLFTLRMFSIASHKYMKYCYPLTYDFAFSKLKSTHLFIKYGSMHNALNHIGETTLERKKMIFSKIDFKEYMKFIVEIWHRINQSTKSFAKAYYLAYQDSLIKEVDDDHEESSTLTRVLINNIVTNYIYQVDVDAIMQVSKVTYTKENELNSIISFILRSERTSIESILYVIINDPNFIKLNSIDDCFKHANNMLKERSEKSLRKILWNIFQHISPKFNLANVSDTTKRYIIRAICYYFALLSFKVSKTFDIKQSYTIKFK